MRTLTILILLITGAICSGQSYMIRNSSPTESVLLNPAVCGADYVTKAAFSYEKQWLRITGAPYSFYATGEMRLGKFDFYDPRKYINTSRFRSMERVGLGAGIYSDNSGPFHELNLLLTYSYHLPLNEKTSVSFGITGKLNHFGVNQSKIDPVSTNDPFISFENYTRVNSGIGVLFYNPEFFGGFSGTNIFNTSAPSMNYAPLEKMISGIGGYRFKNENRSVILEPSVTLKYSLPEKTFHPDFHARIYLVRYGWLNVSYINGSKVVINLALRVYRFYYVAYKYGWAQNSISSYTGSTHGVAVGINLGVNRNTAIIY